MVSSRGIETFFRGNDDSREFMCDIAVYNADENYHSAQTESARLPTFAAPVFAGNPCLGNNASTKEPLQGGGRGHWRSISCQADAEQPWARLKPALSVPVEYSAILNIFRKRTRKELCRTCQELPCRVVQQSYYDTNLPKEYRQKHDEVGFNRMQAGSESTPLGQETR